MTLPVLRGRPASTWILACTTILAAACDADGITDPTGRDERTVESPLAGSALYVESQTSAGAQADAWRSSRPADAERMEYIAAQPQSIWLTGATTDPSRLDAAMTAAQGQARLPVFVLYNVPQRDCVAGQGAPSVTAYETWIRDLVGALDGREAVFVLEPDALAGIACLEAAEALVRFGLLRAAVRSLRDGGGIVYLDAGHSRWQTPATMVERLESAGIQDAHGFSVNVANTVGEAESHEWGTAVAREVQRGFIVDTSRSGAGARSQWCNPLDAALGRAPVIQALGWRDALLWIKRPGESDGPCNGGPAAGTWWPEYALALARAAE